MKPWANEKGAAAVEFALVAPLLLLLLAGAVEYGLIFYNQHIITNASREAARFGIVSRIPRYSQADMQGIVGNYVDNRLISFGDEPSVAVVTTSIDGDSGATATPNSTTTAFGDSLQVAVTFQYDFLIFPNLSRYFSGDREDSLTLSAVTVMRYE